MDKLVLVKNPEPKEQNQNWKHNKENFTEMKWNEKDLNFQI